MLLDSADLLKAPASWTATWAVWAPRQTGGYIGPRNGQHGGQNHLVHSSGTRFEGVRLNTRTMTDLLTLAAKMLANYRYDSFPALRRLFAKITDAFGLVASREGTDGRSSSSVRLS